MSNGRSFTIELYVGNSLMRPGTQDYIAELRCTDDGTHTEARSSTEDGTSEFEKVIAKALIQKAFPNK